MIKELYLKNWKSFGDTTLYIEPVTVLMGLNASGKSNAMDALLFLQRSIKKDFTNIFVNDEGRDAIRGGYEEATKSGEKNFSLGVLFGNEEEDLLYEITCKIGIGNRNCEIIAEKITKINNENIAENIILLERGIDLKSDFITYGKPIHVENNVAQHSIPASKNFSILHHVLNYRGLAEHDLGSKKCVRLAEALENIFILDVQPNSARDYTKITNKLQENGSNVAGFIAGLPEKEQKQVVAKIFMYAKQLPEKEFTNIFVEKIGRIGTDAMLYCEESFFATQRLADARTLSEGTLRFIIILTAILTRPAHSLLVIEEIDNGIHPSRASLLLEILLQESAARKIDILVTTHNEAFLNVLTPHLLSFVLYVHRDKSGSSVITPIDEIQELPRLLAKGNLGDVVADKKLHHFLNGE
jgi:predicted ATPase